MKRMMLSTAFCLLLAGGAVAAERCSEPACCDPAPACCARCGQATVCKIVCEMKKVKKTVWTAECEEFCPLLPGCGPLGVLGCCLNKSSDCGCDEGASCGPEEGCGCGCDPCASLQRPMHPPKCGKVRTRKTLVKKEITCEVPVYKTVVVCAGGCGECGAAAAAPEAAPVPAKQAAIPAPLPPVVSGVMIR